MAELTQEKVDQLEVLKSFLNEYGLGELVGDAQTWITNGFSGERIDLEMRKTPTFQRAFPEIAKLQQLGKPAQSVEAVIQYRKEVKSTMMKAGMPPGFYDQPEDFVDMLAVKDLSAAEIAERVEGGFARVKSAPQEVRDTFNSFFGASGENALAMFFLDPVRGRDELLKQVTQAEISGTGKRFGIDIDLDFAERLRSVGVDAASAQQGFEQVGQMGFDQETMSETQDITKKGLVEGVFGVDDQAVNKLARRKQERSAAFGGGQGGPSQTQEGFGLGSSR